MNAFDALGYPITNDGASTVVPGLFFCGVHFLRKRKSATLFGVGEDAAIVAQSIARTRSQPAAAGGNEMRAVMVTGGYRYVIVGAGSAGCVFSQPAVGRPRLPGCTARSGRTRPRREFRIPLAAVKLFQSAYDWNYRTSKQPQLSERELYWPRGKAALGGSSSINGMAWVRGHRADYDGWAQRCTGWSYDEVLPYLHRAEYRVSRRRRGVRNLRRAVHLALRPFVGRPMAPWPGQVDDANLAQYVQENAQTAYHPVEPAAWAPTMAQWSIVSCASAAWMGCGSSTPR